MPAYATLIVAYLTEDRSLVVLVVRSDSLEVISLRGVIFGLISCEPLFRRYMQVPLPSGGERLHRQVF